MKNPSRSLRVAGAALILSVLAGCSQDTREELGAEGSALEDTGFTTLGLGVGYKRVGDGDNVLLVYGGYGAQDAWSQGWADALVRAKGEALSIGHLYAIRGPNQSGYANHEIANSKLAAHLAGNGIAATARSLVVIAHSSGTFVSDELLNMIDDQRYGIPAGTIGKADLFNLDGGGGSDTAMLRRLASLTYVWGCDRTIGRCSHNAEAMKSLARSNGRGFEVNATGSGCSRSSAGGLWCLHDTLVTNKPHNPDMYDLARDYTDFANGRQVVTSYLDPLLAEDALTAAR